MKAMISMPMGGKTKEEIDVIFEQAKAILEKHEYEVVETRLHLDNEWLIATGTASVPLRYLAESFKWMSKCDAVYFVEGWKEARGCRVEHYAAKLYGLMLLYEEVYETTDED